MFQLIKSEERGHADHGWLKAKHTFSFASYYNPKFMGYRNLLVINQDVVAPSMGFGTHPHRDMEIITYIIHGQIRHKDSMGNDYVINSGELQVMSAGTGVRHSEFNASDREPLELVQIWVNTDQSDHTPRYDQFKFSREDKLNSLKLVIAPIDPEKSSYKNEAGPSKALGIHQDVSIYASILEENKKLEYRVSPQRYAWLQLISGQIQLEIEAKGQTKTVDVKAGDGVQIQSDTVLKIKATNEAEFLLFDLN
jgi:hypothetical protein